MSKKPDGLATADVISPTRRRFLSTTGRAGLLAFGAPALAATWAREACGALAVAGTTHYGLELDGVFTGLLSGLSGRNPITIRTGLAMAKPLRSWIKSSIEPNSKFPRKNVAIIEFDSTYKAVRRHELVSALLTEVTFPLCDAMSTDQARLALTIAPESVRLRPAKGGVLSTRARTQRSSLASHFRLRIEGLEQPTSFTTRIEPMDVKVTVPVGASGASRDATASVPVIEIPNLVVTIPTTRAEPMYQWFNDFVIHDHKSERRGVLDYLAPDLRSTLLSVNFFYLGIVRVVSESEAGSEQQGRSKVEMYCKAITLA